MSRSAESIHRHAVALSMSGQFSQAAHALDQAFERAESSDTRALILGTRAVVTHRMGNPHEAEALGRQAIAMPGLSSRTRATLLGQLGALAMYGGRMREADRWLTAAIDGLGDDTVEAARIRVNRSIVEVQMHRFEDAIADLDRAARTYGRAGLTVEQGQAQHNRAYVQLLRGDLVSALQGMLAARPLAAASPVAAAIGDIDRAEVLRDAGQTNEAEALLAASAPVFGRHRMPQSRAETEFQLARSQLMHDPPKARKTAAASAKRFRSVGNEAWASRADAIRLRAELAAGAPALSGRVPEPRRPVDPREADAVASALDGFGFASEAAALRLSLDMWRSRHPQAGASETRVLRVPRTASLEVRLLAHEARAERAAAAGREAQVRRHVSAGLDELTEWQAAFGSLDLQTSVSAHGRNLIVAGLASAVRTRRPDVLFEWSERARHLSQQVVAIRPPQDPQLAADLAELRHLRADDPTGAWRRDPRLAALEERARERQWSATGAAGIHQRVTLESLRDALDERTALLNFVYSGEVLTALVVTRDRAKIIDLPGWDDVHRMLPGLRADLDMAASIHSGPMVEVVKRNLDDRLAAISAALLDEAVAFADAERIVITVPGVLGGLPWGMLPALRGREFTLAPSVTRWVAHTGAATARTAGFAVGPRVARGDEETNAAASAWPSARVLRGHEATVDAVADLAAEVDLLHVAAHGRHAANNALFSGMELADGTLFGYDVDRIPRVPSIVVLSSCEVGRSSVRWGEEAVGMTRVWLHAGTRAVVATPVIVADDVACELLGAMHAGLVSGLTPSAALADASARTGLVSSFQVHGAGF